MVASFQSTIDPFIQIFPVPANAMQDYGITNNKEQITKPNRFMFSL